MVDRVTERRVDDVATLKALADPLRLAILGALAGHEPEALTVKEVAAEIGEPQVTKLYRHVRQLEQAGLIAVAGTRLVSGIVESRYRVAQERLVLAGELFSAGPGERPGMLAALLAAIDAVRHGYERDFLAGRIVFDPPRDGSPGLPGVFSHLVARVTPERADRLRARLREVLAEFADQQDEGGEGGEGDDLVTVTLFALMYESATPPAE